MKKIGRYFLTLSSVGLMSFVAFMAVTAVTVVLGGAAAVAGPFGLPDHQPNGYRDTGCDPAFQKQILNDAGDYLYSNNPTCPAVGGPSDAEVEAAKKKDIPVEEPCEGDACEGPGDGDGGGEVVDGGDTGGDGGPVDGGGGDAPIKVALN